MDTVRDFEQWQQQETRTIQERNQQFQARFLYPNPGEAPPGPVDDGPPLPEGWGEWTWQMVTTPSATASTHYVCGVAFLHAIALLQCDH